MYKVADISKSNVYRKHKPRKCSKASRPYAKAAISHSITRSMTRGFSSLAIKMMNDIIMGVEDDRRWWAGRTRE